LAKRFFTRQLAMVMPRMRAWRAVPIANQISITIQREQRDRTRPHAKAGRKCKIAARRTTRDCNPRRIDSKHLKAIESNPGEGVLDVMNDLGEMGLGRESIIERDQDMVRLQHAFSDSAIDIRAISADQGTSMNPHNRCPGALIAAPIDV